MIFGIIYRLMVMKYHTFSDKILGNVKTARLGYCKFIFKRNMKHFTNINTGNYHRRLNKYNNNYIEKHCINSFHASNLKQKCKKFKQNMYNI